MKQILVELSVILLLLVLYFASFSSIASLSSSVTLNNDLFYVHYHLIILFLYLFDKIRWGSQEYVFKADDSVNICCGQILFLFTRFERLSCFEEKLYYNKSEEGTQSFSSSTSSNDDHIVIKSNNFFLIARKFITFVWNLVIDSNELFWALKGEKLF